MEMTAEEIVRHYKQAENKRKDIGVLAELNATDTASIKAILIDAGELAPDGKEKKKKPSPPENREERAKGIVELLRQGKSHTEIAEAMDCSVTTVKNYARKLREEAAPASQPASQPAGAPAHQKGEGETQRQQSYGGYPAGGTRGGPGQRESASGGPV